MVDFDGAVGPPGRDEVDALEFFGGALVVFEVVRRIVGAADDFDIHLREELLGPHVVGLELGFRLRPDLVGRLGGDLFVDAESTFEVKVNPLIRRVPSELRENFSEHVPLLAVVGVAGGPLTVAGQHRRNALRPRAESSES